MWSGWLNPLLQIYICRRTWSLQCKIKLSFIRIELALIQWIISCFCTSLTYVQQFAMIRLMRLCLIYRHKTELLSTLLENALLIILSTTVSLILCRITLDTYFPYLCTRMRMCACVCLRVCMRVTCVCVWPVCVCVCTYLPTWVCSTPVTKSLTATMSSI